MNLTKKQVFKISPSSLNLMKEYPRCFWLDKHNVRKRPSGIFPSLPSGMDRILKIHFDKFMGKNELPPELKESECIDGCKLYDDKENLKLWRNNFKGIQYYDEEGNTLFGAVDNILVKYGKLIVLDYKTRGFDLKEDTADNYQNQLDVHNYLLNKAGYEIEDYAYLLFYIPEKVLESGEVVFTNHLIKRRIFQKNAETLFKNTIHLLNNDCPDKTCEWCRGIQYEN